MADLAFMTPDNFRGLGCAGIYFYRQGEKVVMRGFDTASSSQWAQEAAKKAFDLVKIEFDKVQAEHVEKQNEALLSAIDKRIQEALAQHVKTGLKIAAATYKTSPRKRKAKKKTRK